MAVSQVRERTVSNGHRPAVFFCFVNFCFSNFCHIRAGNLPFVRVLLTTTQSTPSAGGR